MKKSIPLFLLGLVIGGGAVWFLAHQSPAAAAAAKPAGDDDDKAKDDDKAAVNGSDIATAAPKPITIAPEVEGYGRVLDPSPLVALATDVGAAEAAAGASAAELARTSALHEQGDNASLQAVETARAAALHDQTQLLAAKARLTAGWGRATGNRSDLAALSRDLANGNAALVRIDLPPENALSSPPGAAQVSPLAGTPSWQEVKILGAAPVSDAQVQGSSYLAVWRGEPLAIGTTLRARLAAPGASQKELVVPESALVRYAGGTFVYVPKDKGYEKRVVEISEVVPAGVVLSSGIGANDKVVVNGAQQLLASELLGSTAGQLPQDD